ncbi:hypothetical protein Csa_016802, partial [Cucumis sativus]
MANLISIFLTFFLLSLTKFSLLSSATAVAKDQVGCSMCSTCDNPCQLPPPPPVVECPPPPPSLSASISPTATPHFSMPSSTLASLVRCMRLPFPSAAILCPAVPSVRRWPISRHCSASAEPNFTVFSLLLLLSPLCFSQIRSIFMEISGSAFLNHPLVL